MTIMEKINYLNSAEAPVSRSRYNCMGYAFGITNWLFPIYLDCFVAEEVCEMLNIDDDVIYDALVNRDDDDFYPNEELRYVAVQAMLKNYPELRQINNFSELEQDEYGIVFACSDYDFHFLRYDNGVYSHKPGNWEIALLNNEDEGFLNEDGMFDGHYYDSERYYFAMKRGTRNVEDSGIYFE